MALAPIDESHYKTMSRTWHRL
ncbi:hypothetical protein F383_38174 [Gossypium arboreum]|uniref:Uncharacterized protein n=1 Tax=Gossypium arboreum TaxID=29729 RepID=A0A0B0MEK7_GOSAR|nr:hypothetical protein F383_38174 [Gossypium arboreum]